MGSRGFGRWDPLPGTRAEVEGLSALVNRTWPDAERVKVLKGGAATEEAMKSAVTGRTILHFATHGFFQHEGLRSVWQAALDRACEAPERSGFGMLLDSSDGHHTWGAIGVSQNVIEASWAALIDSIAYGVRRIARERAGAS